MTGPGTILGLDTSTAATAVCVLRSDGARFEVRPDVTALLGRPKHASELMPAVASTLDAAGIDFADLDSVAVGTGPGGYTGLRIGIATARALAHSRNLPLRPVGSLAALARGIESPVALPLIDARRNQLFASLHVDGSERLAPFVAGVDEVADRVPTAVEAGAPPPLAAGDGAIRFRHALEPAGIEVAPSDSERHAVRALHICRLAAEAPALAPEAVVPSYLREPDATPR